MTVDYSFKAGNGTGIAMLDTEWSTVVNALRVAAAACDQDVRGCPYSEMVPAFRQSATEYRALAQKIAEEAGV